jgi:hypothetical protein
VSTLALPGFEAPAAQPSPAIAGGDAIDLRKLVKFDAIQDGRHWRVGGIGGRRSGEVGQAVGIVALKHTAGYEIVLRFADGTHDTFSPMSLFPAQIGRMTTTHHERTV